jgi:hypothetical protein
LSASASSVSKKGIVACNARFPPFALGCATGARPSQGQFALLPFSKFNYQKTINLQDLGIPNNVTVLELPHQEGPQFTEIPLSHRQLQISGKVKFVKENEGSDWGM